MRVYLLNLDFTTHYASIILSKEKSETCMNIVFHIAKSVYCSVSNFSHEKYVIPKDLKKAPRPMINAAAGRC